MESIASLNKTESIDEIMENFNFKRCRKVMKFLNWKWVSSQRKNPTKKELKDKARTVLNQAWDNSIRNESDWTYNSGGFEVNVMFENGGISYIGLKFVLVDWDVFVDIEKA